MSGDVYMSAYARTFHRARSRWIRTRRWENAGCAFAVHHMHMAMAFPRYLKHNSPRCQILPLGRVLHGEGRVSPVTPRNQNNDKRSTINPAEDNRKKQWKPNETKPNSNTIHPRKRHNKGMQFTCGWNRAAICMRQVTACCVRRKIPSRDRIPKREGPEKCERNKGQDRGSVSVNVKLTLRA